jgi:hypothetical protein
VDINKKAYSALAAWRSKARSPVKERIMSFQTTRQMKDYRQSSQPVCGAVATLFSVYGLKQPVPHESLKLLQDTSWPSGKITKNINQLGKGRQITAKMLSAHTTVKLPGLVNMKLSILLGSRIVFQQRKSHLGQSYRAKLKPRMSEKEQLRLYEETLRDLMGKLITHYKARCLVVSGQAGGWHWQSFYRQGKKIAIYNSRQQWLPELLIGMGPGVVVVKGPAIQ